MSQSFNFYWIKQGSSTYDVDPFLGHEVTGIMRMKNGSTNTVSRD